MSITIVGNVLLNDFAETSNTPTVSCPLQHHVPIIALNDKVSNEMMFSSWKSNCEGILSMRMLSI